MLHSTRLNKQDFYVIIPARMDSTRLPNKMMLDIDGIPLIVRTAKQAQKSNAIKVIVATDHPDIKKICATHDIEAIMTDTKHQTGTDRIAEVLKSLNLKPETIIVNVQGDEPLIEPELINGLANFIKTQQTQIATVAHKITTEADVFNPNVVKVVLDKNHNALYFSRAPIPFCRDNIIANDDAKQNFIRFTLPQETPILRHVGIYAYLVDFLHNYDCMPSSAIENLEKLEQLRALYNGYKIAVLVTNDIPAYGIDTQEDLLRVRNYLTEKNKNK